MSSAEGPKGPKKPRNLKNRVALPPGVLGKSLADCKVDIVFVGGADPEIVSARREVALDALRRISDT